MVEFWFSDYKEVSSNPQLELRYQISRNFYIKLYIWFLLNTSDCPETWVTPDILDLLGYCCNGTKNNYW